MNERMKGWVKEYWIRMKTDKWKYTLFLVISSPSKLNNSTSKTRVAPEHI